MMSPSTASSSQGGVLQANYFHLRLHAEEVYFGKAKDVVGELRSMCRPCMWISGCSPANDPNRPCSSVRDQQRSGHASGNDRIDAAIGAHRWGKDDVVLERVWAI